MVQPSAMHCKCNEDGIQALYIAQLATTNLGNTYKVQFAGKTGACSAAAHLHDTRLA